MARPAAGPARGVLGPKTGPGLGRHVRRLPAGDLAFFVEHFWIVTWDRRGQEPYLVETLPHPSIHLVIDPEDARVVGVGTGKFSRLLTGEGWAFGIKFRPGAFHPFIKTSVTELTDRVVPLGQVFGADGDALAAAIVALDDDEAKIERAERFLRERLPERDANVELVNQVVVRIRDDREIVKVEDVVDRVGLGIRTLQRLFSRYVGVSPKWVIRRYRLHEAVERLAHGEVADWPRLALELGYFDQAHFTKDFRRLVGLSPAEYARKVGATSPPH